MTTQSSTIILFNNFDLTTQIIQFLGTTDKIKTSKTNKNVYKTCWNLITGRNIERMSKLYLMANIRNINVKSFDIANALINVCGFTNVFEIIGKCVNTFSDIDIYNLIITCIESKNLSFIEYISPSYFKKMTNEDIHIMFRVCESNGANTIYLIELLTKLNVKILGNNLLFPKRLIRTRC